MNKIIQPITPDKSISINLEIKSIIKEIDSKRFIKSYKISNFWKGKIFIKKLINRIFKYQLNQKMVWKNNFWDRINISLVNTKIKLLKNFDDYQTLEKLIKEKTTPKRFNDIETYKNLIKDGEKIDPPLYIKGNCINYLGANINNEDIFILDGSRRIVANTLNKTNPVIYRIELKG